MYFYAPEAIWPSIKSSGISKKLRNLKTLDNLTIVFFLYTIIKKIRFFPI